MQTKTSDEERKIIHRSLEERTQIYWKVSSVWNGRGGTMQVGQALAETYNIMMTTSPTTKLAKRVAFLESEIIEKQA